MTDYFEDSANNLIADYRDRLRRAESALLALIRATTPTSPERTRLKGKLEGVRLALSYLREMT